MKKVIKLYMAIVTAFAFFALGACEDMANDKDNLTGITFVKYSLPAL